MSTHLEQYRDALLEYGQQNETEILQGLFNNCYQLEDHKLELAYKAAEAADFDDDDLDEVDENVDQTLNAVHPDIVMIAYVLGLAASGGKWDEINKLYGKVPWDCPPLADDEDVDSTTVRTVVCDSEHDGYSLMEDTELYNDLYDVDELRSIEAKLYECAEKAFEEDILPELQHYFDEGDDGMDEGDLIAPLDYMTCEVKGCVCVLEGLGNYLKERGVC